MTKDDKIFFLHFVTRTGMYINPVDIHNIQNFITGYETGRKGKCKFFELSKDLLSDRYKIKYLSDGWLGQIRRLSEKRSASNIVTFKRIALETIASVGLDSKMKKLIALRVIDFINRIDMAGHPWYNESWKEGWQSLVLITQQWFKELWSKEELTIIKLVDVEVSKGRIFADQQKKIPSTRMLKLKDRFDRLNQS